DAGRHHLHSEGAVLRHHAAEPGREVMTPIIETRKLERTFGAVVAAADINVRIEQGETLGIIGANGAGKTTFVNMITGHLPPSSGAILFDGADITGNAPRQITRKGI